MRRLLLASFVVITAGIASAQECNTTTCHDDAECDTPCMIDAAGGRIWMTCEDYVGRCPLRCEPDWVTVDVASARLPNYYQYWPRTGPNTRGCRARQYSVLQIWQRDLNMCCGQHDCFREYCDLNFTNETGHCFVPVPYWTGWIYGWGDQCGTPYDM